MYMGVRHMGGPGSNVRVSGVKKAKSKGGLLWRETESRDSPGIKQWVGEVGICGGMRHAPGRVYSTVGGDGGMVNWEVWYDLPGLWIACGTSHTWYSDLKWGVACPSMSHGHAIRSKKSDRGGGGIWLTKGLPHHLCTFYPSSTSP